MHGLLDIHASHFQHKNWSWNWSTSCAFSPVHLYSSLRLLAWTGCAPGGPICTGYPLHDRTQLFQRPDLYARLIRWLSEGA